MVDGGWGACGLATGQKAHPLFRSLSRSLSSAEDAKQQCVDSAATVLCCATQETVERMSGLNTLFLHQCWDQVLYKAPLQVPNKRKKDTNLPPYEH